MASIIKPKRTSVTSFVPDTTNLEDGEFGINVADKIIYQRVGSTVHAVANYTEQTPAFVAITQSDYDALSPPNAGTLYIIVDSPAFGAGSEWIQLSQAEYDALPSPDPNTLYIIIPEA